MRAVCFIVAMGVALCFGQAVRAQSPVPPETAPETGNDLRAQPTLPPVVPELPPLIPSLPSAGATPAPDAPTSPQLIKAIDNLPAPDLVQAPTPVPAPEVILRPIEPRRTSEEALNPEPARPLVLNSFPLHIGSLQISPRFSFGIRSDDNVFLDHKNKRSDIEYTAGAQVTAVLGQFGESEAAFSLSYAPSYTLYQRNGSLSSFNQTLSIDAAYRFTKLTLSARFGYSYLTGAERDVGGRADRGLYALELRSSYIVTEKTSVEFNTTAAYRDYKRQISSGDYGLNSFVNYQVTPKVNLGLGAAFIITSTETSPEQTSQQLNLRAVYAASEKVSAFVTGGLEYREFGSQAGKRVGDKLSPIFGLGLSYAPFDGTNISVSGNRGVQPSSIDSGTNYASTNFSFTVNQRFMQKLYAAMEIGYENSSYSSATVLAADPGRADNFYYARPRVSYSYRDWLQFSAFYTYRVNESSVRDRSFDNQQFGLDCLLSF